jgi:hypothetical protein
MDACASGRTRRGSDPLAFDAHHARIEQPLIGLAREAAEVRVVRGDDEEEEHEEEREDSHVVAEDAEPVRAGLAGGEEREEPGVAGKGGGVGVGGEDGEEDGEGEVGGGAVPIEADVRGVVLGLVKARGEARQNVDTWTHLQGAIEANVRDEGARL